MENDIKVFVKGIIEKTGLDFSVYSANGEFICGATNLKEKVPCDFEGIKTLPALNKTVFYIKYKSKSFIGCLEGATKIQENYAYLITELAENAFLKDAGLTRAEFCKAILLGEVNHSQISKYVRKYEMKDLPAFVMVISANKKSFADVLHLLKTYSDDSLDFAVDIDDNQLAYVKFVDEIIENEYQSSTEYAMVLKQSIYEETGSSVKIAIGSTVKTLADLSTSFAQAMTAVRMSNALNSKGDIHSFKEYMLIKMLEDMPKYKLNEYLEILLDNTAKEIFFDEEMTNTAEEFLENSLNVSETSRKLYLHRNTLTYRLDKIEKGAGLDIRKFSDAVTFRLITILSKLVK